MFSDEITRVMRRPPFSYPLDRESSHQFAALERLSVRAGVITVMIGFTIAAIVLYL